jgi:hypothetical protein
MFMDMDEQTAIPGTVRILVPTLEGGRLGHAQASHVCRRSRERMARPVPHPNSFWRHTHCKTSRPNGVTAPGYPHLSDFCSWTRASRSEMRGLRRMPVPLQISFFPR